MYKLEAVQRKLVADLDLWSAYATVGPRDCPAGGSESALHLLGIAADVSSSAGDGVSLLRTAQTCGFSGITVAGPVIHVDSRVEDPRSGATSFAWSLRG
jgi:hypothetical protein